MSLLLALVAYIVLSYPVVFFCIRMWPEEIVYNDSVLAGSFVLLAPITVLIVIFGLVFDVMLIYICETLGDFVLYWRR